jgi:hypothetical protein
VSCLGAAHDYEATAVDDTFGSWRGFRDSVVATLTGRL